MCLGSEEMWRTELEKMRILFRYGRCPNKDGFLFNSLPQSLNHSDGKTKTWFHLSPLPNPELMTNPPCFQLFLSACLPQVIRNPKVGMSNAPKENKGIKSSRSPGTPLGLWFSTSWKAQFIRGRTDWLHMNFLSKRNPLPGSRSSFNLDIHGRKSIQHLQPRCLAAFRVTAF